MASRRFADVGSSAMAGAGTGATIGAAAGPYGIAIGAGAGAILGGVAGYFASKADDPERRLSTESMRLQNRLGMAQLGAMEDEQMIKRRKERARKMFASQLGAAFKGATGGTRGLSMVGVK